MSEQHDDQKLDLFLKKNAPTPPLAPLGEKQRIWRAIQAEENRLPWWRTFTLGLPQLRVALPVATALAITLAVMVEKKHRRDAEIDRILGAALSYQLEEAEESGAIF